MELNDSGERRWRCRDSQLQALAPKLTRDLAVPGDDVTVCIAAIAEHSGLFVAADRMRTAGNIQYEPATPKIFPLTTSIVMMTAGDSQLNREIIANVELAVSHHLATTPNEWINVRDVVDWYNWHRQELKRKAAENEYLRPLGLNTQSFFAKQQEMSPDLVQELARHMVQHAMPTTHVIVAGVDNHGTHVYSIRDGNVAYHNAVGFAAIGIGYWHVESEFTSNGHHPGKSIPETLSLIYRAKRRAETAPGVGKSTDVGMILGGLGTFTTVADHVLEKLEALSEKMERQQNKARDKVHMELMAYVTSRQQEDRKEQGSQEPDGPERPVGDADAGRDPAARALPSPDPPGGPLAGEPKPR